MRGLHLTADLHHCQGERALLTSATRLAAHCRALAEGVGLAPVGECFHASGPAGVTGVLLLAQSHVAVRTWPERNAATVDVHVRDVGRDDAGRARALLDVLVASFAPRVHTSGHGDRSAVAVADAADPAVVAGRADAAAVADDAVADGAGDGVDDAKPLLEWLDEDVAFGFRVRRRIANRTSPCQRIEMLETRPYGTVMRLDGRNMTSERDEFHYHEAMVHPAALSHPAPRRALVIGGGDGGSAEELLKHPSIERVDLVEIDADVVELSRRHLPRVHRGAFDDPRLRIRIEDGARFVDADGDGYDLVVLDLTDPDTAAAGLYDVPFFRRLAARLAPGGTVSLHVGSPFHAMDQVLDVLRRLHAVFPIVRPLATHVPLYGTYWAFAIASLDRDPRAVDTAVLRERLATRSIEDLRLYHAGLHAALFALPAYFAERLAFLDAGPGSA